MTNNEKDISFLNRYFVYKKVRTVNAEKLTNEFLTKLPEELEFERAETIKAQRDVIEAQRDGIEEQILLKPKTKKINKKIVLQNATEALEGSSIIVPDEIQTIVKKTRKNKKKVDFVIEE